MTLILAIDPGTTQSGVVLYLDGRVVESGIHDNPTVLEIIERTDAECLAVEMVESFGMAVGKEVFRTVWWTGRFAQAWLARRGCLPVEVTRKAVKLHLCGTTKAKDPNIRQALLDRLGEQGTKKAPGPTYGVKSHAWSALAVAVTAAEGG